MASFAQFGNDLFTGRRQIDFIGKRRRWYLVSLVLIVLALIGIFGRGLNFSLEFTGGSEVRVASVSSAQMADYDQRARDTVRQATGSDDNLIITKLGDDTVRVQSEKLGNGSAVATEQVRVALADQFKVPESAVTTQFIGPSWGETVTRKAIIALIVFLILVSVVLAIYFRTWTMAAAAVIALLHDLIITVGIYALTGLEVSPATMIGFLTILGYSMYDTVVVFDKVRENTQDAARTGRRTYAQAANYAVNQTLVRSINTSVVALLPIASLLVVGYFFIGPGTLLDLSLALFIGIAVGTYSSIFVATPVLASLRSREPSIKEQDRRALAYQAAQSKALDEVGGEHRSAESISGVIEPEQEKAVASAQSRARSRREIHPRAKREE